MLSHIGTKTLTTKRLTLSRFVAGDASGMFNNWASDDEVTRYLSWPTHKDIAISQKVIDSWLPNYESPKYYHWAIRIKESGAPIGSIALVAIDDGIEMCEIGYCIGRSFWNKGMMTEALQAVIAFCFHEVGFNRVIARHHVGNSASGKVMQKCGMKYEGLLRQVLKNNKGEFVDGKYYSILKEEYHEKA